LVSYNSIQGMIFFLFILILVVVIEMLVCNFHFNIRHVFFLFISILIVISEMFVCNFIFQINSEQGDLGKYHFLVCNCH
jgi:hypothetical protein